MTALTATTAPPAITAPGAFTTVRTVPRTKQTSWRCAGGKMVMKPWSVAAAAQAQKLTEGVDEMLVRDDAQLLFLQAQIKKKKFKSRELGARRRLLLSKLLDMLLLDGAPNRPTYAPCDQELAARVDQTPRSQKRAAEKRRIMAVKVPAAHEVLRKADAKLVAQEEECFLLEKKIGIVHGFVQDYINTE